MLSLSITDTKAFMGKLLKHECFDDFDFHSMTIHNFACFEVDKMPTQDALSWKDMRHYAFEIIKGSVLPKYIKVVLSKDGSTVAVSDTLFFLNILYENGSINISTGVSQKSFNLDKSAYIRWEEYIIKLFNDEGIVYSDRLLND